MHKHVFVLSKPPELHPLDLITFIFVVDIIPILKNVLNKNNMYNKIYDTGILPYI